MPDVPVLSDKCAKINLILAKLAFAKFYEAWIRFIYINYVIINHAHKLKNRYLGIETSPINFI
jgi:hypothetical protein